MTTKEKRTLETERRNRGAVTENAHGHAPLGSPRPAVRPVLGHQAFGARLRAGAGCAIRSCRQLWKMPMREIGFLIMSQKSIIAGRRCYFGCSGTWRWLIRNDSLMLK